MKITIVSPSRAEIEADQPKLDALAKYLTYKNTSLAYQYRNHLKNRWFKSSNPDGWQALKKDLESRMVLCLLQKDSRGYWTRPGVISRLIEIGAVSPEQVESQIKYPKGKPAPWYKPIPFKLYPYQQSSVEKLIEAKHGNVELCTGAGKSMILLNICRQLGLRTVIATPSASIFGEIHKLFSKHLGKNMVGALGDGKKVCGKQFTVCIAKSLTNLKPGSAFYEHLSKADVLLVDESHLFAAETLEEVCHGVLKDIPYRMFFSGTQTRGDGTELALKSIIGKTVETVNTADAIRDGFIANHEFVIVKALTAKPSFDSRDALAMKREHLLRNPNVAQFIAKLANASYNAKGEQTLVLVDEISQIEMLKPLLTVPYAEATGQGEPDEAVEKFNKGIAKVLIGTSCIATGTNIYPVHNCVNWVGGSSEIKTKQGAVGRSVRKLEGSGYEHLHKPKTKAVIWDFDIVGIPVLENHLKERIRYYEDSGSTIRRL